MRRDFRSVTVTGYQNELVPLDEYGQTRTGSGTPRTIQAAVYPYQQNETNDARYLDVSMILLTTDEIFTTDKVSFNGMDYDVVYVIPSRRYTQALLRELK